MDDATVAGALARAGDELGLDEAYRPCVRPLLRTGRDGYPRCCGGACEPCSELLGRVADRALAILGVPSVPSI